MSLRKILQEGKSIFGVHLGIVSRVKNDWYHIHTIDTDYNWVKCGETFALENTYCRDVVTKKQTMTFDDVAEITEMLKHPVYLNTQLRAYIGTPLILNNQIWGTLNFSSLQPKKPEFTQQDFKIMESLAKRVTKILDAQGYSDITSQASVAILK